MKEEFKNLREEIKSTTNKRTLIFHKRRANNIKDEYSNSNYSAKTRKSVNREYSKTLKEIHKKDKQLS